MRERPGITPLLPPWLFSIGHAVVAQSTRPLGSRSIERKKARQRGGLTDPPDHDQLACWRGRRTELRSR